MGILPDSSVFNTRSALFVQVAVISFRYLAWAAPSFFCSGMGTVTLPASSTECPIASRRASSPATRTAEGPMSTPRRDWPRSRGTPITRIFLGTMLEKAAVVGLMKIGEASSIYRLRVQTVQHSGEGDGFAHMFQAADPGDGALDSHSESRVGNATILAQIEIPLEGFLGQPVLVNALEEQIVRGHALRAADDLSVAFRRQHIDAKRQLRTLGIRLHVESLYLRRVAVHHHRLVELRRNVSLIRRTQVSSPPEVVFESAFGVGVLQHPHGVVVRDAGKRRFDLFQPRKIAADGLEIRPALFQAALHQEADQALRQFHDVVELAVGDFGLDHPEFGQMAASLRFLGAKRRTKGIHLAQGHGGRFDVELP